MKGRLVLAVVLGLACPVVLGFSTEGLTVATTYAPVAAVLWEGLVHGQPVLIVWALAHLIVYTPITFFVVVLVLALRQKLAGNHAA